MRQGDYKQCRRGHDLDSVGRNNQKRCRACCREDKRKFAYGLSPMQYQKLLKAQNGCCAGCGDKVKLVVDHDHKTGCIRGLLCQRCNLILGYSMDSVEVLSKLIDYLKAPSLL